MLPPQTLFKLLTCWLLKSLACLPARLGLEDRAWSMMMRRKSLTIIVLLIVSCDSWWCEGLLVGGQDWTDEIRNVAATYIMALKRLDGITSFFSLPRFSKVVLLGDRSRRHRLVVVVLLLSSYSASRYLVESKHGWMVFKQLVTSISAKNQAHPHGKLPW